ncbi:MAG: hypothetical protein AAF607_17770 [Pseudomonadota bacterium]
MRRYYMEFGGALALYVAVLMAVVAGRPADGYQGAARSVELLPFLPLLLGFWAILRQYARFDEFYKNVHAQAFALGAMLWGLSVMAWGFAENAGLMPLPTLWVAPGLIAFWGLSMPIVLRRYK